MSTLPAPIARTSGVAFALAWGGFWLLLATIAVQGHRHAGGHDLWKPLLWEGTSCLVATLIVAALWRPALRHDRLLHAPARWLLLPLALLPLVAPLFVGVVFALRHGVHGLVGEPYRHAPWAQVLVYESLKFAVFYLLFTAVFFGWRSYAAMQAERLHAQAERAAAREAQLAQLAQQIEPHFLFNALNTIASSVHEAPDVAERLLLRLAALLRAATDLTRRPRVTLAEELQLLQNYADIMVQRFADRVQIEWRLDRACDPCALPALLLQPLLENAFRHGVERTLGPVHMIVSVQRPAPDAVEVAVDCSAGRLDDADARGTGLATVERRLTLAYGGSARLSLEPRPGGGTVARIVLPFTLLTPVTPSTPSTS